MTFRRSAAILLALILALSGMLHAWCMPAMAGGMVAVCTPHGVAWVPADGPDAPPTKAKHDCAACQAGHCGASLLPPATAGLPVPDMAPALAELLPTSAANRGTAFQLPPARGPPPFG